MSPGHHAAGRTAIFVVALGAVAVVAVVLASPEAQASTTRLVVIAAGVVVTWLLLGRTAAVTAATSEWFEAGLVQRPEAPSEISSLRAVETDLRMSAASAFGLEFRLKPQLRELAAWRLMRSHGVDLDRSPEAARRLVGDQLWELMRPATEPPEFREPGAGLAQVQAGIDRLERI